MKASPPSALVNSLKRGNDSPQLMGRHTCVSTSDVVTEGIMDEHILVLGIRHNCKFRQYSRINEYNYRATLNQICMFQLTKVCTICVLLLLISLTNSKTLRSFPSFNLSIMTSIVMKVPVRPTPALYGEMYNSMVQ